MRTAAPRPPGRPRRVAAFLPAGLGAAAVAGGLLPGCAALRDEGFTQGGSCDPVVQSFDQAELVPRPDELAGDLLIGPGYGTVLPGGANGVSRVGCGPAGCGPAAPTGFAAGGPHAAGMTCVSNGAAAERGNRPDLAVAQYRRALMHDPACPAAHHRLAVLLDGAAQFPAAEQHYAAALAARPHDADLLCDAGYSLLLQGRTDEAEATLRTALAKTPDHARSLENLALLAARRGDRAAAETALLAVGAPGAADKLAVLFPPTADAEVPPAAQVAAAPKPASPVRTAAAVDPSTSAVVPADVRTDATSTGLPAWGGELVTDAAAMRPVPSAAPAAKPADPTPAPRDPAALPLWPPAGGAARP